MNTTTMNAMTAAHPGQRVNPGRWIIWTLFALILIVAPLIFGAGAFGFHRMKPVFQQVWGTVNTEIEEERHGDAA